MRSLMAVLTEPLVDNPVSFLGGVEQFPEQATIAKRTKIKIALVVSILPVLSDVADSRGTARIVVICRILGE